MFDPNVFNDSKQVLNDCFVSESFSSSNKKDLTLITTNEMKGEEFLCTTAVG